jgi:hypothetical protein
MICGESRTNLKTQSMALFSFTALLVSASLIAPRRLNGQAAPGPIAPTQSSQQPSAAQPPQPARTRPSPPQVQPRTTLAGPWKLNRDESDDPRQKARAAEGSDTSNVGGYPGGGYPGGGYPGGGPWGGSPYPRGGGSGQRQPPGRDIEDNPRMQSLLYAPTSVAVDLKSSQVDVTDTQLHRLTLYTDGRQLPKSTDSSHEEVLAHWEGSRLVSDEKSPLGGKMSRTFELSQEGRQMFETLRIDNGRSKTPIVIRYVFDVSGSDAQSEQDSDPNRPVLKRNPSAGGGSPQ